MRSRSLVLIGCRECDLLHPVAALSTGAFPAVSRPCLHGLWHVREFKAHGGSKRWREREKSFESFGSSGRGSRRTVGEEYPPHCPPIRNFVPVVLQFLCRCVIRLTVTLPYTSGRYYTRLKLWELEAPLLQNSSDFFPSSLFTVRPSLACFASLFRVPFLWLSHFCTCLDL